MQIHSMDYCRIPQSNIESVVTFFESLDLSLNLTKCKIMSFNKIRALLMS